MHENAFEGLTEEYVSDRSGKAAGFYIISLAFNELETFDARLHFDLNITSSNLKKKNCDIYSLYLITTYESLAHLS